jgi:hypothetical protein
LPRADTSLIQSCRNREAQRRFFSSILLGIPSSGVGWIEREDLYVPVREIDPVMNGKSPVNRNLHSASNGVVFIVIRVTGREIPNL